MLSGPAGEEETLTDFHPMENQLGRLHASDPERYPRSPREGYHLDPMAFMKLQKRLEAEGSRVRAIFHTHPDVGAYFSEEDRRQATWDGRPLYPGVVYLVCGIKGGRPDGAVVAVYNEASGGFDVSDVAESPA